MQPYYRKTRKGQTEVETRQWRLPPRLRGLLILVNGHRDAAALSGLLQQPADTLLATLVEQGFVDTLADAASAERTTATAAEGPAAAAPPIRIAAAPPRRATAGAAVAAVATGAAAVPRPAVDPRFDRRRQAAVHALHDELGAAGQTLADSMAQASNADELRPLLAQAAQRVAALRGRPAAEVYAMRFLAG